MLAASSWRVAVNAGADSTGRLMQHLRALEETRSDLLKRMPTSLGARFDRACAQASLPETVIAALVGVGPDDIWDIRNAAVIPPGALPRVRAFTEAVESAGPEDASADAARRHRER
jgi:hypothetical protein